MAIEIKNKQIGFRAATSERLLIEKQAAKLNMRLSSYVRLCVLNDIMERRKASK